MGCSDDGVLGARGDGFTKSLSECEPKPNQFGHSRITLVGNPVEVAILTDQKGDVALIGNQIAVAVITGTEVDITLVSNTILIAINGGLTLGEQVDRRMEYSKHN